MPTNWLKKSDAQPQTGGNRRGLVQRLCLAPFYRNGSNETGQTLKVIRPMNELVTGLHQQAL